MNKHYAYSLVAFVVLSSSVLVSAESPSDWLEKASNRLQERVTEVRTWKEQLPFEYQHPIKAVVLEGNERFGVLEDKALEIKREQLAKRAKERGIKVVTEVAKVAKEKVEETLSAAIEKAGASTPAVTSERGGPVQWVKENPKKAIGFGTALLITVCIIAKRTAGNNG